MSALVVLGLNLGLILFFAWRIASLKKLVVNFLGPEEMIL